MAQLPSFIPPDVNISANMQLAKSMNSTIWFYNMVRNKGPWDFKQRHSIYENFGNFHYGAVGHCFGFPDFILMRAAGWAQSKSGNETNGTWYGSYPYGDDYKDQQWIKRGIEYARERKCK